MIKAVFTIAVFLLSVGLCAQEISREALTSGGDFYYNGEVSLSMSIGQFVVPTYLGDPANVTQAYQQPDYYCFGDYNFDGTINTADLLIFLTGFGCPSFCFTDLNFDDTANTADLLLFLTVFGTACPQY
jgi:hypothetical protein